MLVAGMANRGRANEERAICERPYSLSAIFTATTSTFIHTGGRTRKHARPNAEGESYAKFELFLG